MRTITFFSYKGGTGRSLAVANAAYYLAQLGFKVVVLDFDLEAPGLCYKFSRAKDGSPIPVTKGLVDYLSELATARKMPPSLKDYTTEIDILGTESPSVTLFPAGRAPSTAYWESLCRINWHELFYSPDAKGVKLFLDLKSRIEEQFAPQFLLIDSRTGVTEMGGVATTILADVVVCILLNNRENLEGARAVLRSLGRYQGQREEPPVSIVVALSRLPELDKPEEEDGIIAAVRDFLSDDADDLSDTLPIPEVFVLHSEPALQLKESLRIGAGFGLDDSVLLRDYLRLFSQIVPPALIEPRLAGLFQTAKDKIWIDPEATTKEIEQLVAFCGHPEGFRELLRVYVIRNILDTKAFKAAQRFWELTHDSKEPLLQPIVRNAFRELYSWRSTGDLRLNLDFVESVWRASSGELDRDMGLKLAGWYDNLHKQQKATAIYLELVESGAADDETVARAIDMLLKSGDREEEARALIEKFRDLLGKERRFLSSWAEFALKAEDTEYLTLLSEESVLTRVLAADADTALRLARSQGKLAILENNLGDLFRSASRRGPSRELIEVGRLYTELGKLSEFEKEVKAALPEVDADHLLHEVRMGLRETMWSRRK